MFNQFKRNSTSKKLLYLGIKVKVTFRSICRALATYKSLMDRNFKSRWAVKSIEFQFWGENKFCIRKLGIEAWDDARFSVEQLPEL